jgi:hypothetical protein
MTTANNRGTASASPNLGRSRVRPPKLAQPRRLGVRQAKKSTTTLTGVKLWLDPISRLTYKSLKFKLVLFPISFFLQVYN